MDHLEILHQQLTKANVSDDMIGRGVRLTTTGTTKLARKLNVSEDELAGLIDELAKKIKGETEQTGLPSSPDLFEDESERFQYEDDIMGNVMLRDTKTGATKYIGGDDGQKLLREIERVHPNYQGIISPYFNKSLREFAEVSVDSTSEIDDGNTGGTYNFPFRGNFACARFWLAGAEPRVEVVSIVDENGHEVSLDDSTMAAASQAAWEWVNKV